MRQTISGLVAAIAVVTVSAAPAMACGGGLFSSSCGSPCGGAAYVSPCGGYGGYGYGGYGYGGYGYGAAYERLPEPTYYHVNQGPTFSGPGMFAPVPTYQESAVSGWGAYGGNTYYGYDGGRYANATNHYYDGMPAAEGPAIYGYRARAYRHHYGHGYSMRPSMRYGYAARHSYAPRYSLPPRRYDTPHHSMRYGAPRYAGPRYYGHHERALRRYY